MTCTAERWWDLCPNITDICYEPRVRPPAGTELYPEMTQLEIAGKFHSVHNLDVYAFLLVLLWGQITSLLSCKKRTLTIQFKCQNDPSWIKMSKWNLQIPQIGEPHKQEKWNMIKITLQAYSRADGCFTFTHVKQHLRYNYKTDKKKCVSFDSHSHCNNN